METTQELKLTFKTSEGKTKSLSLEKPKDNLEQATVEAAMQKVVEANIFEKAGAKLFNTIVGAEYVKRTITPVFKKA